MAMPHGNWLWGWNREIPLHRTSTTFSACTMKISWLSRQPILHSNHFLSPPKKRRKEKFPRDYQSLPRLILLISIVDSKQSQPSRWLREVNALKVPLWIVIDSWESSPWNLLKNQEDSYCWTALFPILGKMFTNRAISKLCNLWKVPIHWCTSFFKILTSKMNLITYYALIRKKTFFNVCSFILDGILQHTPNQTWFTLKILSRHPSNLPCQI